MASEGALYRRVHLRIWPERQGGLLLEVREQVIRETLLKGSPVVVMVILMLLWQSCGRRLHSLIEDNSIRR